MRAWHSNTHSREINALTFSCKSVLIATTVRIFALQVTFSDHKPQHCSNWFTMQFGEIQQKEHKLTTVQPQKLKPHWPSSLRSVKQVSHRIVMRKEAHRRRVALRATAGASPWQRFVPFIYRRWSRFVLDQETHYSFACRLMNATPPTRMAQWFELINQQEKSNSSVLSLNVPWDNPIISTICSIDLTVDTPQLDILELDIYIRWIFRSIQISIHRALHKSMFL